MTNEEFKTKLKDSIGGIRDIIANCDRRPADFNVHDIDEEIENLKRIRDEYAA